MSFFSKKRLKALALGIALIAAGYFGGQPAQVASGVGVIIDSITTDAVQTDAN